MGSDNSGSTLTWPIFALRTLSMLWVLVALGAGALAFMSWAGSARYSVADCTTRTTTEGTTSPLREVAVTPGGDPVRPETHYILLPFQLVCNWQLKDGQRIRTTYIELGTPNVLAAMAALGLSVAGFITASRERGARDSL
ncbi:hypothetical protein AWU67_11440 [Microterricola viridarii]|uniref:Uncharacterized protein n=1 Tax=Microterricola viridarii TaxID=412690 RepID=A0A120I190_9MICO|nr:hypothetical protein AWU67_11440 [Microterricola viridarii]